jgi:hypothetical protein
MSEIIKARAIYYCSLPVLFLVQLLPPQFVVASRSVAC